MKKCLILLAFLINACSETSDVVSLTAHDGKDGQSCLITQVEGGYNLSCAGGAVFVSNGTNGVDGAPGPQGLPGVDGQNGSVVTVTTYTSSSCAAIGGGYYGTAGSNNFGVYTSSSCASSSKVETMNDANSSLWLSTSSPYILSVFSSPNGLSVIQLN